MSVGEALVSAPSCDDGGFVCVSTDHRKWSGPPCSGWESVISSNYTIISNKTPVKEVGYSYPVPGWHKLLENGDLLPMTDYNVSRSGFFSTPMVWKGRCDQNASGSKSRMFSGQAGGIYSATIPGPPVIVEELNLDKLLQSAWADANSQGFDLLTNVAESPETFRMFDKYRKKAKDRLDHVRGKAYKSLIPRSGRKPSAARLLGQFQNIWMEVRYGWRPLVGAADEIVEEWEARKDPDRTSKLKVTKSDTLSATSASFPTDVVVMGMIPLTGTTCLRKNSKTGRATVVGIIRESSVPRGININPLATAWELVPYSFVVDWFVNTSDLFQAHWPKAFFEQSAACVSVKDHYTVKAQYKDARASHDIAAHPTTGVPVVLFYSNEEYTRIPRHDVPLSLTFDLNVTVPKAVDLLILMKQKFKRSSKILRL